MAVLIENSKIKIIEDNLNEIKKNYYHLGDPSGIGPDLCVKLATQKFNAILIVVGNKKAIEDRAKCLIKKL